MEVETILLIEKYINQDLATAPNGKATKSAKEVEQGLALISRARRLAQNRMLSDPLGDNGKKQQAIPRKCQNIRNLFSRYLRENNLLRTYRWGYRRPLAPLWGSLWMGIASEWFTTMCTYILMSQYFLP